MCHRILVSLRYDNETFIKVKILLKMKNICWYYIYGSWRFNTIITKDKKLTFWFKIEKV